MDPHAPDFTDHICLLCARLCANRRSLGNHLAKSHATSIESYVLDFFCPDKRPPLCACGCNERVAWAKTAYHFNAYVNGHNDAGFRVKQPDFTPEQVAKRAAAIKRAYAERPEIREKISVSIKTRLSSDTQYSANMKRSATERWATPGAREAQSETQRVKWAEDHDARVERVFTEEFGKKISAANARRDIKRTSRVEAEFVEKLKSLLPDGDVEASKWFNFGSRHVCADAWSKSLGAIFELDGDYWHGLDRDSDFTADQLHNMTQDLEKDALFAEKRATVYRFSESCSRWRAASSVSELLESARHALVTGDTVRDGLFKLDRDDHPVMTRDALLVMPEDEKKRLHPLVTKLITACVKRRGFFFPPEEETLREALTSIAAGKPAAGSSHLQSRFKSFWLVSGGPAETCADEEKLPGVIAYRMGLSDSKPYEYTLADGSRVQSRETFDITPKQVRRGCLVSRRGVSWFRPSLAMRVWERLLGDLVAPVVWDPSAGFGARMLGFAARYPCGAYQACEPAALTYRDNERLASALMTALPELRVSVKRAGSETAHLSDETCDAVFTSPPFFDREKYFDEPGQCWRDHPTLERWVSEYVIPTMKRAEACLKRGGKLALHLPADLIDLFCVVIESQCGSLARAPELDLSVSLRADHFSRKRGIIAAREETVVVWTRV